jgi:surface antigen
MTEYSEEFESEFTSLPSDAIVYRALFKKRWVNEDTGEILPDAFFLRKEKSETGVSVNIATECSPEDCAARFKCKFVASILKTSHTLAVLVCISLLSSIVPSLTYAREAQNTSASSLSSISQLRINLRGAYYQASGNQFIEGNNLVRGVHPFECTEFAYGRAIERGLVKNKQGIGTVLNGDAHTWDDRIADSSYRSRLKTRVRANSFVVWEANLQFQWSEGNMNYTSTTDPTAGHVAFVEKVYPDGSFLISEGVHQSKPSIRLIKGQTPQAKAAKFIYL